MRIRQFIEMIEPSEYRKITQALHRYCLFLQANRQVPLPEPGVITRAARGLFPEITILPQDEVIQFVRVRKSGLVYWRIRKIAHPELVTATFDQKLWVKRKLTGMM